MVFKGLLSGGDVCSVESLLIGKVVKDLSCCPHELAEFVVSVKAGTFRKDRLYKTKLSRFYGDVRGVPLPKTRHLGRGKCGNAYKVGDMFIKDRDGVGYCKTLRLVGKTPSEQVRAIMGSDMDMSLKREYLEFVANTRL